MTRENAEMINFIPDPQAGRVALSDNVPDYYIEGINNREVNRPERWSVDACGGYESTVATERSRDEFKRYSAAVAVHRARLRERRLLRNRYFGAAAAPSMGVSREWVNAGNSDSSHLSQSAIEAYGFSFEKEFVAASRCDDTPAIEDRSDTRCVVPLATADRLFTTDSRFNSISDKRPIMCVNRHRLEYTCRAFRARQEIDQSFRVNFSLLERNDRYDEADACADPLEFLLNTDFDASWCDESRTRTAASWSGSGVADNDNIKLSDFLRRLTSTGYERYVFALARHIGAHLDIVYDTRVGIGVRYTNRHRNFVVSQPFRLTAVRHGANWYVFANAGVSLFEKTIASLGVDDRS